LGQLQIVIKLSEFLFGLAIAQSVQLAYFEKSTATAFSISVSGISPDVEGALEFVEGGELPPVSFSDAGLASR